MKWPDPTTKLPHTVTKHVRRLKHLCSLWNLAQKLTRHTRPPITQLFSACCEKRPSLAWRRRQTRYSTVQSAGVLKHDGRYLHTSLWWRRHYYKMPLLSYVYKHIPYKRLMFRLRFLAPGVNYRRFSVSSPARHARGLWKSICVIAVTGETLQGRSEFVGWLCAATFLLDKERFAAENKTIITSQQFFFLPIMYVIFMWWLSRY